MVHRGAARSSRNWRHGPYQLTTKAREDPLIARPPTRRESAGTTQPVTLHDLREAASARRVIGRARRHRGSGARAGTRGVARRHALLAHQRRYRARGHGPRQQVARRQGTSTARSGPQGCRLGPRGGHQDRLRQGSRQAGRAQRARLLLVRRCARGARRRAGRSRRARRVCRRRLRRDHLSAAHAVRTRPRGRFARAGRVRHSGRDRAARRATVRASARRRRGCRRARSRRAAELELLRAAGCVALGSDPDESRVELARAAGFFATSDAAELEAEAARRTARRGADGSSLPPPAAAHPRWRRRSRSRASAPRSAS